MITGELNGSFAIPATARGHNAESSPYNWIMRSVNRRSPVPDPRSRLPS
jgi:hypothetical protein